MSDVKLQDWPEGKRLRITYCHGKDKPRAIPSYAGKWHFFEPVRVEIEPHPEGFYVPARDYDRQAAEIARLRAELTTAQKYRDAVDVMLKERCNSPVRDHETPLRALQRLINFELTTMALDPKIHKGINGAIATARREGEAAGIEWGAGMISAFMKIADKMSDGLGLERDPVKDIEFAIARTLEEAAAIRAAAKEEQ